MKATDKKVQKTYTDHGFGFPVKLLNVPMIKVRGKWTPHVNYNDLTEALLIALCEKPVKLTGHEIRFVRLHFQLTLKQFAKRFAVSHAAVIKWEKTGDDPTNMAWTTEKDLRLFILSQMNSRPVELVNLYNDLEELKPSQKRIVKVDLEEIAA